jgi:hypothetical protein
MSLFGRREAAGILYRASGHFDIHQRRVLLSLSAVTIAVGEIALKHRPRYRRLDRERVASGATTGLDGVKRRFYAGRWGMCDRSTFHDRGLAAEALHAVRLIIPRAPIDRVRFEQLA